MINMETDKIIEDTNTNLQVREFRCSFFPPFSLIVVAVRSFSFSLSLFPFSVPLAHRYPPSYVSPVVSHLETVRKR